MAAGRRRVGRDRRDILRVMSCVCGVGNDSRQSFGGVLETKLNSRSRIRTSSKRYDNGTTLTMFCSIMEMGELNG